MWAPTRARLVVAVVGEKGTGKTKVVEGLVRALRAKGLKVCTAKHVPEEDFSLDRPGKDSWRHAEAGALAVTIVSPGEIDTIRRFRLKEAEFDDIVALASQGCDVLIVEGFSSMAGQRPDVLKVVVVRGPGEAKAIASEGRFKPILAFVGPGEAEGLKVPYLGFGEVGSLADRIANMVLKARAKGDTRLFLGPREVPLNAFVKEVLKRIVLAFASCLKGVDIRGDEDVMVFILGQEGDKG